MQMFVSACLSQVLTGMKLYARTTCIKIFCSVTSCIMVDKANSHIQNSVLCRVAKNLYCCAFSIPIRPTL